VAVSAPQRARDWSLSREAFERMLLALDPDRERAALRYERIRARLRKLLVWRGVADPDPLVDEVFDRVARRLEGGLQVTAADPYALFHGVALNVLQEQRRRPARHSPLGEAPPAPEPPDPVLEDLQQRRLDCLARCLERLPAESRRLLEDYQRDGPGRIRARQELARRLGIDAGALRLRAFRIRAGLGTCIEACEKAKA
jgi:DNA-directed RNA polymerase specialized sigma24 family protein